MFAVPMRVLCLRVYVVGAVCVARPVVWRCVQVCGGGWGAGRRSVGYAAGVPFCVAGALGRRMTSLYNVAAL